MELLNFEKFLFCVKCDFSIFQPSESMSNKEKVFRNEGKNFTMTMNAIYFFDNEPKDNKESLENILIFKIIQEEWYISDYEESSKFIVLSRIKEDIAVLIELKRLKPKEVKDIINICILFDGYKTTMMKLGRKYSDYFIWLYWIIDNYLSNGFSSCNTTLFTE